MEGIGYDVLVLIQLHVEGTVVIVGIVYHNGSRRRKVHLHDVGDVWIHDFQGIGGCFLYLSVNVLHVVTVTHFEKSTEGTALVFAPNIELGIGIGPYYIVESVDITLVVFIGSGHRLQGVVFVSIYQGLAIDLDGVGGSTGIHIRVVGVGNRSFLGLDGNDLG